MGTPIGHSVKKGKKNRKHGRNFRIPMAADGIRRVGTLTRYRITHNIPAGSRQDNHILKMCPVHAGRMTFKDHISNRMTKLEEAKVAEIQG